MSNLQTKGLKKYVRQMDLYIVGVHVNHTELWVNI